MAKIIIRRPLEEHAPYLERYVHLDFTALENINGYCGKCTRMDIDELLEEIDRFRACVVSCKTNAETGTDDFSEYLKNVSFYVRVGFMLWYSKRKWLYKLIEYLKSINRGRC